MTVQSQDGRDNAAGSEHPTPEVPEKAKRRDPMADEVERLRRENERLAQRLQQAEAIIDVQKKVSEILGVTLPETNGEND